jgi:hypothetical protein
VRSLALTLVLLSGCVAEISPYARATAGRVGCPAQDIDIRDEAGAKGPLAWTASCMGKRYACSSTGSLMSEETRVVCNELGRAGNGEDAL